MARTHPDLVVVEALGEMIRIDRIRALHHDLHMRPFEGSRRVYVVLDAHLLNEDAADALLKDLEEPPGYATMVLVADELGPLPETIRSRCQLVPFRRLSDRAVREWMDAQAADLDPAQAAALARVASGRLDRARRLLDPAARERRDGLLAAARSVYAEERARRAGGRRCRARRVDGRGCVAREREEEAVAEPRPPRAGARAAGQARTARRRARRAARLARRARRLVPRSASSSPPVRRRRCCTPTGWPSCRPTSRPGAAAGAERAAELARDSWRVVEEFNVNPQLWLEALFVRLRRAFA